jgi:hypothetical protein
LPSDLQRFEIPKESRLPFAIIAKPIWHSDKLRPHPRYGISTERAGVAEEIQNFLLVRERAKKPAVQAFPTTANSADKRGVTAEVNQQCCMIIDVAAVEFDDEKAPRSGVGERTKARVLMLPRLTGSTSVTVNI